MRVDMVGQQIGSFLVESLIGEGGMGKVYLARHQYLNRRAAVKFLLPTLACQPEIVERFLREATAANTVEHPGIVTILDFGRLPDGTPYLMMEYLEGESLADFIKRAQRLSYLDALRIGWQLAVAVSTAHAKGVIHRDLKPENVKVMSSSFVFGVRRTKILDFGIALMSEPTYRLTRIRSLLGTPRYMAPELFNGGLHATDRSDVYALGVIFHVMLTGSEPFDGTSDTELLTEKYYLTPKRLSERGADVTPALDELVARMLSRAASERPPMAEVAEVLGRLMDPRSAVTRLLFAQPKPPTRRRKLIAWLLPSLIICCAALVMWLGNIDPLASLRAPSAPPPRPPLTPPPWPPTAPPPPPIGIAALPPVPPAEPRIAIPLIEEPAFPQLPPDKGEKRLRRPAKRRPSRSSGAGPGADTPADEGAKVEGEVAPEDTIPRELRNPFQKPSPPSPKPVASVAKSWLERADIYRMRGQWREAEEEARRAAANMPQTSWGFLGRLACERANLSLAQEAYGHLTQLRREALRDVCTFYGIHHTGKRWVRAASGGRTAQDRADAIHHLQEADSAYHDRLWDLAIKRAGLASRYSFQKAWQLIALAACCKGDSTQAGVAIVRLDPPQQFSVRGVCRERATKLGLDW